jgi:methylmalonyl-CoA mutase C-terminal domain/subunit
LRDAGLDDVLVFGGGVIPAADVEVLEADGVARVFTPGAGLADISRWLAETLDQRESALRK